ncbi:MAG: hypothetical protein EOO99_11880 [Pedobacter sp.]|nr:MAG: hypothetical protein EOO99_11880 [Pedobacter sp.]
MTVDTTSTLTGDVTMGSDASIAGSLTVAQDCSLNADLYVAGAIYTSDISYNGSFEIPGGLTVGGSSELNDVSMNALTTDADVDISGNLNVGLDANIAGNTTINGDLTVNGSIYGYEQLNTEMEINYLNLTGSSSNVSGTITLQKNTGGSSGTNNATNTSSTCGQIVISNRTATSYDWNLSKGDGDNVNIYLVFLVVYNLDSDYPSSY